MPKISIVIPAYNYARYISDAVLSTINQTYRDIEIIVVDDGSTDNTSAVAQELYAADSRVCYIHQHNQGLSAARNTGLRHAQGEFVVFLDADDMMHPEKIQAHMEHFQQQPLADISYGRSRYFLSGQPDKSYASLAMDEQDWMPKASGVAADVMPSLVRNNIMPVCSAMLRRSAIARIGDFDTTLKSLEDWDYWIRAAAADCRFEFSEDERLAAFIRVHESSMSKNALRMLTTEYLLRKKAIPVAMATMSDKRLASEILAENTKLKILRLIAIAESTGIANPGFLKLCYDDSFKSVKKAIMRYLKRRSASKASL